MKRLATAVLAVLCLTGLVAAKPGAPEAGFNAYRPAVAFKDTVTESFYVPMRDGNRIAMTLIRPATAGKAAPGKFPVIWHDTLDIAPGAANALLPTLARHGYVVAIVARRGNGASFGVRRGYEDFTDTLDEYEIIEWLGRQAWSTGKVGMWGCSNTGEAVMHAMTARAPHLKAAFAGCFSWDRFDGHTRGGIIANYGTGPQRTLEEDMKATPVEGDKDKALLRQAATEHLKSTDLFALMKSMPYRDSWSPLVMSRFWSEVSIGDLVDTVRQGGVPLYIEGGWNDDFRAQAFVALANLPGQARVVIGPWRHCRFDDFDMADEALRFFDYHMKGIRTGIEKGDIINYYTVNAPPGRQWRSSPVWPVKGAVATAMMLSGDRLAANATDAAARSFRPNYADACPPDPLGGGPYTQPCHPRTNIAFTGETLARDTEVTGSPIADLWISSSRDDAHLYAYLEDVGPDGKIAMVSEGRQKASLRKLSQPRWSNAGLPWHRSYAEDEQKLKPGEAVEVVFDLLPTSYVFKAGHRLQIAIAGSDPRERQRMEGEPPTITVYSDAARRSKVTLPIVR